MHSQVLEILLFWSENHFELLVAEDWVEVGPIPLGFNPNFDVVEHYFEHFNLLLNVVLDMDGVLRLGNAFQSSQVLFNSVA